MHSKLSTSIILSTTKRIAVLFTQSSSFPHISIRHYSTTKRNVHLSSAAAPAPHHGQFHPHASSSSSSPPPPPLKTLPNLMLLRSLFVAAISSHRFLLIPALSTLQFLTRPHASALFSVERNPVLHTIIKKTFYNHFCGGENGDETRQCVKNLKGVGFRGIILTYARETVFDHETQSTHALLGSDHDGSNGSESSAAHMEDLYVREWKKGAMESLAMISSGDFLALKLTGAGPTVTTTFEAGLRAPSQMMDALRAMGHECKSRGVRMIIDAESTLYQHGIDETALQLMREFNKDGTAVVYNTYQAYLKKTPSVVTAHMLAASTEGFTLGLKLVRGAYISSDHRAMIHDTKQDTDDCYNHIIQGALERQFADFGGPRAKHAFPSTNLFLASHNRESVFRAYRLHRQRTEAGLPTVPISYGQLQGMADSISFGLLAEAQKDNQPHAMSGFDTSVESKVSNHYSGPDVFKCTTWGSMSECIAYLLRRAVENRDSVLRTRDEYNALRSEVRRRWFSWA